MNQKDLDLEASRVEKLKTHNDCWILKGPFGPMVHRDTGESYQAMFARTNHEYEQSIKQANIDKFGKSKQAHKRELRKQKGKK